MLVGTFSRAVEIVEHFWEKRRTEQGISNGFLLCGALVSIFCCSE